MALSVLPSFLVLRSSDRYLSLPLSPPTSVPPGFLKFDEVDIWSPRVKFAVEPAQTGDGKLVHIRSCYNNKYLVGNRIQSQDWIVASSDKPDEDQSKATCTLFEPFRKGTETVVHLRYLQNDISAAPLPSAFSNDMSNMGLVVSGRPSDDSLFTFDAINWETLVILPSRVAFKSEENGNYLKAYDDRNLYQQFVPGLNVGHFLVPKELFPTPDGNYRIQDMHFNQFWRRSPNWIWVDASDNDNTNETIFSIVKLSDNVIAIRSLGNDQFLGPQTLDRFTNCLSACYPTISRETRLIVEERVLERNISNVKYRLSDSRIYQESSLEIPPQIISNDVQNNAHETTLTFSISDSRTTHWTANSVSVNLGVSVKFEVTTIPLVARGGIELSTENGSTYEWGEANTTVTTRDLELGVVVPPLITAKVTLMYGKAACDVPFSYTQRDLLTTGELVTTLKDDGMYTGINSYNF